MKDSSKSWAPWNKGTIAAGRHQLVPHSCRKAALWP